MPRIPLFDIPNAPAANPTPEAQSVPRLGVIDITGVSRALQRETLPRGSFASPGMAAIGDAVASLSPVFGELGERVAMSKNYADLARAEDVMGKAQADFQARAQGIADAEWSGLWEKEFLPAVQEQISALGLSPWARDRVMPQLAQFAGRQRIAITHDVMKRQIDRDRAVLLEQRETKLDTGNFEGAEEVNHRMEALGMQTATQRTEWSMDATRKVRNRGALEMLNRDPLSFEQEMEESAGAGMSDVFPWMQAEDITRYLNQAQTEVRGRRVEARQSLHNSILAGEITDEASLRSKAGPYLGETEIKSLVKSMGAAVVYDAETTSKLRTDIANYDPRADRDLSVFNSLQTRIESTVTKDVQGPLGKELWDSYSRAKEGKTLPQSTRLKSAIFSTIDNMTEQGLLGPTGTSSKPGEKGKITDSGIYLSSFEKAQQLKDDAEQFLSDNPDAKPEDVTNWFKTKVSGSAAEQAAKAFVQKEKPVYNWAPYGGGGLGMPQQGPRGKLPGGDIRKKLEPAAIRYNNPGAMYPGPSSERFGATGEETIGGGHKIAVFPDAQSGAAAQFDLLDRAYTGKTLTDAITKWSGGNSVSTYLTVIEKNTGLKADTVLTKEMMRNPKIAIPLARAMSLQEAGKEYPLSESEWLAAHTRAFES